jgi:hypothetical protein
MSSGISPRGASVGNGRWDFIIGSGARKRSKDAVTDRGIEEHCTVHYRLNGRSYSTLIAIPG